MGASGRRHLHIGACHAPHASNHGASSPGLAWASTCHAPGTRRILAVIADSWLRWGICSAGLGNLRANGSRAWWSVVSGLLSSRVGISLACHEIPCHPSAMDCGKMDGCILLTKLEIPEGAFTHNLSLFVATSIAPDTSSVVADRSSLVQVPKLWVSRKAARVTRFVLPTNTGRW